MSGAVPNPPRRAIPWAETLFRQHADLYLPFLQRAIERGSAEAASLAGLFQELGLPGNGAVLDVACGIGRHTVPLAQRGLQVTGIDVSPRFIEEAQRRAHTAGVQVRHLVWDVLKPIRHALGHARFDAFISMFTSFGFYGEDKDLRLFQSLEALAKPGAALVIDTMNRDWLVRNFREVGIQEVQDLHLHERRRFNLETSTSEATWSFYREAKNGGLSRLLQLEVTVRAYSLHELKGLLERAGWTFVRSYGASYPLNSFEIGAFGLDSPRMWVVAQAG